MKASAMENLGYYELKQYKPWFDEERRENFWTKKLMSLKQTKQKYHRHI
jgi:hypothetical protein